VETVKTLRRVKTLNRSRCEFRVKIVFMTLKDCIGGKICLLQPMHVRPWSTYPFLNLGRYFIELISEVNLRGRSAYHLLRYFGCGTISLCSSWSWPIFHTDLAIYRRHWLCWFWIDISVYWTSRKNFIIFWWPFVYSEVTSAWILLQNMFTSLVTSTAQFLFQSSTVNVKIDKPQLRD